MTTTFSRPRRRGRRPSYASEQVPTLPILPPSARAPNTTAAANRARRSLAAREKAALWERLEADGRRIALAFGLEYRTMEPEREGVRRHYGITYSDGTIRIRLRHAKTGRALKYSSLVNTVCHELAHLRHFNHGPRFKAYYFRILEWARAEGIYRPSTTDPLPPMQLGLFRSQSSPPGRTPTLPRS